MPSETEAAGREFSRGDAAAWHISGLATGAVVGLVDWSFWSVLSWLAVSVLLGSVVLPVLWREAVGLLDRHDNLWLGALLGWGLGPGPLLGGILGALSPVIFGLPVSSLAGSILGLVVGPIFAAVEGLTICFVVCLVFWLATGERLDRG